MTISQDDMGSITAIAEKIHELGGVIRNLDDQRKLLRTHLLNLMESNQRRRVRTENTTVSVHARRVYDLDGLRLLTEIIHPQYFEELIVERVDSQAVARLRRDTSSPEILKIIDTATSYSNQYVTVRERKSK